jgi:hypothetical protein
VSLSGGAAVNPAVAQHPEPAPALLVAAVLYLGLEIGRKQKAMQIGMPRAQTMSHHSGSFFEAGFGCTERKPFAPGRLRRRGFWDSSTLISVFPRS